MEKRRVEREKEVFESYNFDIFENFYLNKEEKRWRVPDIPPQPPDLSGPALPTKPQSREQALRHLDSVFIDDALKDDIVTRVAIPDLLDGNEPSYGGVILFGPPGTGKTVLLRAVVNVYRALGAYANDISVSSINSAFVGEFARRLEGQIQMGLGEAQRRKKPSFLSFDEGSILAQNAMEGASSVSKHYQEAIDVMKRYIGNERSLVVGISTNVLPESFEDALTREGRLTAIFIGYPDTEQRQSMWKHFANEYKIIDLTDEQTYRLAEATPTEQGAFIEEFCRNYTRARRAVVLRKRGYSTLVDALKHNANITDEEVRRSITFDNLYVDLAAALKTKYDRLKEARQENGSRIGFSSE